MSLPDTSSSLPAGAVTSPARVIRWVGPKWIRITLLTLLVILTISLRGNHESQPHAQAICTGSVTCPPGTGLEDPICTLRPPNACGSCTANEKPIVANGIQCCYFVTSPIILDLDGTGFHLTNVANGVDSPILLPFQQIYPISWTAPDHNNAWLVLDRNGNGRIDDFSEMFGNLTPQPDPPAGQFKNGFLALAVYDQPQAGGNGDGWISAQDGIFSQLRVWQDTNHDGVSQPEELHTLESVGIAAISLDYSVSKKQDRFGNKFNYRSVVRSTDGSLTDKKIYDVFLLVGNPKD